MKQLVVLLRYDHKTLTYCETKIYLNKINILKCIPINMLRNDRSLTDKVCKFP